MIDVSSWGGWLRMAQGQPLQHTDMSHPTQKLANPLPPLVPQLSSPTPSVLSGFEPSSKGRTLE